MLVLVVAAVGVAFALLGVVLFRRRSQKQSRIKISCNTNAVVNAPPLAVCTEKSSPRCDDTTEEAEVVPKDEPLISKKKLDKSQMLRARANARPKGDESELKSVIRGMVTKESPNVRPRPRSASTQQRDRSVSSGFSLDFLPLQASANRWTPTQSKNNPPNTINDETERVQKIAKGILNKLTPEKFERLSAQLCELDHTHPTTLATVVDLIFDTALTNPFFLSTYANLIALLCEKWPAQPDASDPKQTKNQPDFRAQLLAKCQKYFAERGQCDVTEPNFPNTNNTSDTPPAAETTATENVDPEEEKRNARARAINNVLLIGQLYCSNVLPAKIMHMCVQDLLEKAFATREEQEIVAVCKLLTTAGKQLDTGSGVGAMDQYLKSLEHLARQGLEPRLNFLILDTLDLRKQRWQPRREKDVPKKLKEIRTEMDRTVFRPPTLRLQPARVTPNRFSRSMSLPHAAVKRAEEESNHHSNNNNSNSNNNPNGQLTKDTKPRRLSDRGVAEMSMSPTLRDDLSSNNESSPLLIDTPSSSPEVMVPITSPLVLLGSPKIADSRQLVKDFFLTKDAKQASEHYRRLDETQTRSEFVYRALSLSFDGSDADRATLPLLFKHLHAHHMVSQEDFAQGFSRALSQLPDLLLDVPHGLHFASQAVTSAVVHKFLTGPGVCDIVQIVSEAGDEGQKLSVEMCEEIVALIKGTQGLEALNQFLEDMASDMPAVFAQHNQSDLSVQAITGAV